MATGERKWSSTEQKVTRTSFAPIPPGEYELKVKRVWETRKSESEKSSQLRYANGYFEVVIPGKDKPRRQYHSFYVDLSPGSDGELMPNRGGQITEFAHAVGEKLSSGIIKQSKRLKDGSHKEVDTLSPKAIVEFMNNLDGTTLRAKIKVEKNLKGVDDNVIEYFIENGEGEESSEESESEEEDIDGDESEESDESSDDDEAESDDDEVESLGEEELEDLPPAKDTGKSKVKQGPPAKAKPAAKPSKKK